MDKTTLEICYPDGTCARWIVDDENEAKVSAAIVMLLGQPDTLT